MTMQLILQRNDLDASNLILRWTERLANDFEVRLKDRLEDLPGVEHVHLRRYSATIFLATHVITYQAFASILRDVISQPPLQAELTVIN
jgi:hypothetical protein